MSSLAAYGKSITSFTKPEQKPGVGVGWGGLHGKRVCRNNQETMAESRLTAAAGVLNTINHHSGKWDAILMPGLHLNI